MFLYGIIIFWFHVCIQAGSLVLLTCVTYLGHSLYSLCSLPHVAAAARATPTARFASALIRGSSFSAGLGKKVL